MQNVIVSSMRIEAVLKYFVFYFVGGPWIRGEPVGGTMVRESMGQCSVVDGSVVSGSLEDLLVS